jgi:hypothetical protein
MAVAWCVASHPLGDTAGGFGRLVAKERPRERTEEHSCTAAQVVVVAGKRDSDGWSLQIAKTTGHCSNTFYCYLEMMWRVVIDTCYLN